MHELCPFCGAEPKLIHFTEKENRNTFIDFAQVHCSYCGATSKKIILRIDWDDGYDCESGDELASENDAWKAWDNRATEKIVITKVIVSEGIEIHKHAVFNEYVKKGELIRNGFASFFKNMNPVIICPESQETNIYTKSFAKENNIPIEFKPINWNLFGKSAGYKRNKEIAELADCMLAFWDGKEKNTKYLIDAMHSLNKPVTIIQSTA